MSRLDTRNNACVFTARTPLHTKTTYDARWRCARSAYVYSRVRANAISGIGM